MGTRHFRNGFFLFAFAGALVGVSTAMAEGPEGATETPVTTATTTASTTTVSSPGLATLNLLRPRASADPDTFNFRKDGSLALTGDGWQTQPFSAVRKTVYHNGPSASAARDYVEITKSADGRPTRAIIFGARDIFSEFNVASIEGGKVNAATRCTSEVSPSERKSGELTCWTLNKEACTAIMKEAGVDHAELLLGKIQACMELKGAIRKIANPEYSGLIGKLKKQQEEDVAAMRLAQGFSPRLPAELKFVFDDPTQAQSVQYQWVKYLAIASSCNAIMGQPEKHKTIDEVAKGIGYKGSEGGNLRGGPRPPTGTGVRAQ